MSQSISNTSFTGSIPKNYDTYFGPFLFEFSAKDMAQRVAKKLDGPARILEVACGTGISTRHLSQATDGQTTILATDLNQAMLDYAGAANGTLAGVEYQQADAMELPFSDNAFDAVVCQFGVMFFPDRLEGLKELVRVLKPGGWATVTTWDRVERNPSVEVAGAIIQSAFASDPRRFLEVPYSMHNVPDVLDLMQAAGLTQIDAQHVSAEVETDDLSRFARGIITGTPNILEIESRATSSAEDIIIRLTAALRERFGTEPAKLPFREITFQGRKPEA